MAEDILLEGAQGALLDNNWGTYPFCTASTTLAAGACAGLGIAPRWIQRVVGVTKAYTTRVGAGPMPSELFDEDRRDAAPGSGQEFGTVTGRARRCGWFDAELVRFTAQINGVTELALTKLDVLDELANDQDLHRLPPGRRRAGSLRHYWEGDAQWLGRRQPGLPGNGRLAAAHPRPAPFQCPAAQAQAYVRKIEELVGGAGALWCSAGPEPGGSVIRRLGEMILSNSAASAAS